MTKSLKPRKPSAPHKGSLNDKMAALGIGERVYIDTQADSYMAVMRQASAASRRPASMLGMRFSTVLVVGVVNAHDIRHLVCITRNQ